MFVLRTTPLEPKWLTLTGTDVRVLVKPLSAQQRFAAEYRGKVAANLQHPDAALMEAAFLHGQCRALADQI